MLTLAIREKDGQERQLTFDKTEVTIGRATGSDIVLPRSNISKRHARLVDQLGEIVVVDQRSTNGTYINGRRITAPHILKPDDKIYIGDFVIRIAEAADAPVTTTFTADAESSSPRLQRRPTLAATPPVQLTTPPAASPPPVQPRPEAPAPPPIRPPRPPVFSESVDSAPPMQPMDDREEPTRALDPLAAFGELPTPAELPDDTPIPAPVESSDAELRTRELLDSKTPIDAVLPPETAAELDDAFGDESAFGTLDEPSELVASPDAPALDLDAASPAELVTRGDIQAVYVHGLQALTALTDSGERLQLKPLSSEAALQEAWSALAPNSAAPADQSLVTLPGIAGGQVRGLRATGGLNFVWRRLAEPSASLAGLVAENLISQEIADAVTAALRSGAKIALLGPAAFERSAIASAIAAEIAAPGRIVRVGDGSQVATADPQTVALADEAIQADQVAALEPDLIVFERLIQDSLIPWLDLSLSRTCPMLTLLPETAADRALERLAMRLSLAQGGASPRTGAAWTAAAFDLVIALEADDKLGWTIRRSLNTTDIRQALAVLS